MIVLTYDKVDNFVNKLQNKGVDVRWEGWDMVFFKSDKRALRSTNGRYRNGAWGFETTVSPDTAGKWLVDYRLARGNKSARG